MFLIPSKDMTSRRSGTTRSSKTAQRFLNVHSMNRWLSLTVPGLLVKEDLGTYTYFIGEEQCLEPLSRSNKYSFVTTDIDNCLSMSRTTRRTENMALLSNAISNYISLLVRNYDLTSIWSLLERLTVVYAPAKVTIDREHMVPGTGPCGTPTKSVPYLLDGKPFFSVISTGEKEVNLTCRVASVIEAIAEKAEPELAKTFMRHISG